MRGDGASDCSKAPEVEIGRSSEISNMFNTGARQYTNARKHDECSVPQMRGPDRCAAAPRVRGNMTSARHHYERDVTETLTKEMTRVAAIPKSKKYTFVTDATDVTLLLLLLLLLLLPANNNNNCYY